MASKQANKRLTKEYLGVQKSPVPYILTKPKEDNILEWHYVITGPEDSPYAGGEYWGKVMFPADYPFKPPGLKMMTPNGRFKTDYRLCLSMSDYHPDTWNPAWSISTILTGLLSFMLEDTSTTGAIQTTVPEKKILAKQSKAFNRTQQAFKDLFPELVSESATRETSEDDPNTLQHKLALNQSPSQVNLQQQNQQQSVRNRHPQSKSSNPSEQQTEEEDLETRKEEEQGLSKNPSKSTRRIWKTALWIMLIPILFVCLLIFLKLKAKLS